MKRGLNNREESPGRLGGMTGGWVVSWPLIIKEENIMSKDAATDYLARKLERAVGMIQESQRHASALLSEAGHSVVSMKEEIEELDSIAGAIIKLVKVGD